MKPMNELVRERMEEARKMSQAKAELTLKEKIQLAIQIKMVKFQESFETKLKQLKRQTKEYDKWLATFGPPKKKSPSKKPVQVMVRSQSFDL